MQANVQENRFGWTAGGWFGGQLGGTVWLFLLGVVTVPIDLLSGLVAFASFVVGNLWGVALWRRRQRLPAYSGLQLMWLGLVPVFAAAVVTTRARAPSVMLPYWTIAVPLVLMAVFWLKQHGARRSSPST
jgi:hypothetical protein